MASSASSLRCRCWPGGEYHSGAPAASGAPTASGAPVLWRVAPPLRLVPSRNGLRVERQRSCPTPPQRRTCPPAAAAPTATGGDGGAQASPNVVLVAAGAPLPQEEHAQGGEANDGHDHPRHVQVAVGANYPADRLT